MKSHYDELLQHEVYKSHFQNFLEYTTDEDPDIAVIEEIIEGFTAYIQKHQESSKRLKQKIGKYFQTLNLIEFVIDIEPKYSEEHFLDFWRRYNKIYNTLNKPDEIIDDVEIYFDNKIGIVAPVEYKIKEKNSVVNDPAGTYGGKQYRFHILAVIEKKNQEEEAIEELIKEFENKIIDLFEFVKSDDKGKRLVAKILDEGSAFSSEEVYDDFQKIFRKYVNRNRTQLGEFFIKETKDLTNQLCDDFERLLKEEGLYVQKKSDSLCEKSISEIIALGEGKEIEYKSSLRYCLKQKSPQNYIEHSAFKNIAAFLNTSGGVLLVGVEDNGNIIGLEETDYPTFKDADKKDAFLKHFDNLLANYLGNEFNSLVQVDIQDIAGKKVAKICVKKKAPEGVCS